MTTTNSLLETLSQSNTQIASNRTLSEILAPYAPGYVRVYRPGDLRPYKDADKDSPTFGKWLTKPAAGKEPIESDWPKRPQTYDQVISYAHKGGNIGLIGGVGNLVILDFDSDRDGKLAKWPELASTVEVYRDTAADRAKFIVHIDGDLPPSAKNHDAGLEILSTRTQGVIYGKHHTGARIKHRGDTILTTTADRIMQFWKACGCKLPEDKRRDAGPPDAEAVAASMELAEAVMAAAAVSGSGWQSYDGTGRKIVLGSCPFNPTDDPHAEDRSSAIVIGADGHIGATCHHARCQERIKASGKSGWRLLKELAGYEEPRPAFDPELAPALMDVIRHLDPEDWSIGTSGASWRNTTAAALAIVKIAQVSGKYTDLSFGVRRLAEYSGLSKSVAARAVKNLVGWFIVPVASEVDADDPGVHRHWNIAPAMLEAAADACFRMGHLSTGVLPNTNVSHSETSTLRPDYMAQDAFILRKQPMTESELAEKITKREAQISDVRAERAALEAAGVTDDLPPFPRPVQRRRYIRQLRATVASPGPNVLLLMDMIDALGPMTRSALAESAHISRTSCWRAIRNGIDAGCLDIVDGYVCMAEGWAAHIEAETPKMPTAGVMIQRRIDNFGARIAYLEFRLKTATETAEKAKLKRGIARVTAKRQKLIAEQTGKGVGVDVAGARLTDARFYTDSLQTRQQVITARKPRQTMTADQYHAMQIAMELSEDAAATWARMNSVRSAELGSGWFANMSMEDVLMDFAHFAATGYGVTA